MMYHRPVEIPAELRRRPTVVVDSEGKDSLVYPMKAEMAGYDTNRLIQAGCKRIVYYGFLNHHYRPGERFAGIAEALADRASPSTSSWSSTWKGHKLAAGPVSRVRRDQKPDGIFCFNDVPRLSSTRRPESGRSASAQTFP